MKMVNAFKSIQRKRITFMGIVLSVLLVLMLTGNVPYGKFNWKALAQYSYGAPTVSQCASGTTLSTPFPQSASGEFLIATCLSVTGQGTVNVSLSQVLANLSSSVTESDKTQIQNNPALMSVWRMGSWFLVPSSYNAATQTYSFESAANTNIYGFFYGAITRPVGSQGANVFAGTTTGNVDVTLEGLATAETPRPPAAVIIATAFVAFTGAIVIRRQRKANAIS